MHAMILFPRIMPWYGQIPVIMDVLTGFADLSLVP
jgi:hypothetical protein